ncbi:MAG TPA: hypothetical protein VFK03_02885 [Candidatus Saccharimonadales bacterium]|nr:hypothetical protein [Candidatus Saccharimonadales bacterium]
MDEDNQPTDAAEDPDLMQDLPDDQLEDVQQGLAGEDPASEVGGDIAVEDDIDDETEPAA